MWDTLKKLLKKRQLYIGLLAIVLVVAMVLKLYNLQITNGDVLNYYANKGSYSVRTIEAQRGKIYDRNGKLIAYNRTGYNVQILESGNLTWEQRDAVYAKLLQILNKNGDTFENALTKYITPELTFGVLIDDDTDADELTLRKNWIQRWTGMFGVSQEEVTQLQKTTTAKEIFDYFRQNMFKIDSSYSEAMAYDIMAIRYTLLNNGGLSTTAAQIIATDISEESMAEIENRHLEFPGISTVEVYFRQYNNAQTVSHVLGYVRAMSEQEYENIYKELGYTSNEIVGKEGIEKAAEKYLRGQKGSQTIYVDKNGGELGTVSSTAAIPGKDVYLTIDLDLQEAALNSMKNYVEVVKSKKDDVTNFGDCVGGAVVVMDIKSGEVLASVSYPDYDPNIFLASKYDEEAQQAITDLYADSEKSASLNRATMGLYAPGSVFKPIVALAALENKVINKNTICTCNRTGVYSNFKLTCLGHHGRLSVIPALVKSCNIFFYDVSVDLGITQMDQYAKAFGLGELTGIEIAEYAGTRSNPETMEDSELDLTHVWSDADTAQTSIGQLYSRFTPMQLARYAATFGNGGNLVTPHLIGQVVAADGTVIKTETVSTKIEGISSGNMQIVKEGMIGVVSDPSASINAYFKQFDFEVAGKTGTPETGEEAFGKSSNGVFVCYAPADNPQIAVSVVLEHGVWGSNAAYIASEVLEAYFSNDVATDEEYKTDGGTVGILP